MTESLHETYFSGKPKARAAVCTLLEERAVARGPFPVVDRIPDFIGSDRAAERLLGSPVFTHARRVRVPWDGPQRHVAALALARGIEVYVPSHLLANGYVLLDPRKLDATQIMGCVRRDDVETLGSRVEVKDLPILDAYVIGSIAVTTRGDRVGRGWGTTDLEFAILRELGHPAIPVMTTVHVLQFVALFPGYEHDVPLSWMGTPESLITVPHPGMVPKRIDWERLPDERLDDMPLLKAMRPRRGRR